MAKRARKEKIDPAREITNEIIALLEKGTMPWRRPWRIAGGSVPLRHTGDCYQGINAFLLGLRAAMMGYSSPYWMTFQQARSLGASMRKGAKSSITVYYGTSRTRGTEAAPVEADGADDEGGGSYRVFNAAQIEGLDAAWHPESECDPAEGPTLDPEAWAFFEAIDMDVRYGGDRAYYIPSVDCMHMPELARFESAAAFLATLGHEMAHATKAPHRLDRSFGVSSFGNETYAKEELVAEMMAVGLGQRMGFCADHIENHAAYLGSWLRVLRNDKSFLFKAAADAQRAVDYLAAASEAGRKSSSEVSHEAA